MTDSTPGPTDALPDPRDLDDAGLVALLLDRFGPEAPLVHLDPDEPVERLVTALRSQDAGAPARLAAAWRAARPSDAEAPGLAGPPPTASTWPAWHRYVGRLLGRLADGPPPGHSGPRRADVPPEGRPLPPTTGTFPDPETADRAVTTVLRAHEAALRDWWSDPLGRPRLFLHADVGRPVGTLGPWEAGPAHCAVVVLDRDLATDHPFVLTAYPERVLDARLAARHPDLPMLFGAFFGPDVALDGGTWAAERLLNERIAPPVRARLLAQLRDLLDLPDGALGTAVRDLGCHLDPVDPRRWVDGLCRRMSEAEWGVARQPVVG